MATPGLPILGWDNFIRNSAVLLFGSSWQTAFPIWNVQNQSRVIPWRSKLGWNVIAGFNDKIDFLDGATTRVATLVPANYATGADYLLMVQTQMNAVSVTNTWTGAYSTSTFKATLSHDNVGAGSLLFDSGANKLTSAHLDLGYTSTDKTGGSSYTAENVSYHSREYIISDLGSAQGAELCSIFDALTLATGGEIRVQGNATNVWTAPTFNQLLTSGLYFHTDVFTSTQTFRYWRILVDDVQNTNGYSQLSYVHIGDKLEISVPFFFGYTKGRQELSGVNRNYRGNTLVNLNSTLHFWNTQWIVSSADRTALETALDTIKAGVKFVFILDSNFETVQELSYLLNAVDFNQATDDDWSMALIFHREHGAGLV